MSSGDLLTEGKTPGTPRSWSLTGETPVESRRVPFSGTPSPHRLDLGVAQDPWFLLTEEGCRGSQTLVVEDVSEGKREEGRAGAEVLTLVGS